MLLFYAVNVTYLYWLWSRYCLPIFDIEVYVNPKVLIYHSLPPFPLLPLANIKVVFYIFRSLL